MVDFFVYLSPKCHRLSEQGKEYTDAYIFIKQLSAGLTHPILLNFRANKDAHRLKLRMGAVRFDRLLKAAISLKLACYERDNLKLISHTQERQVLKTRSATNYEPVKVQHVKQYIQISILKANPKRQKSAIKHKLRSTANKRSGNVTQVNADITLSCRNAAKLLNLRSYSHTNNLLTSLSGFGLVLTPNRTEISESMYNFYKQTGKHNARYHKSTGKYYFLGANHVKFNSFYNKPIIKTKGIPYYLQDNW